MISFHAPRGWPDSGEDRLDLFVQLPEIVARHRGVHVVLGVVVHVPVEEAHERIQDDRPAAEPVIGHVVLQPHMLGVVAQILQPAAVETAPA